MKKKSEELINALLTLCEYSYIFDGEVRRAQLFEEILEDGKHVQIKKHIKEQIKKEMTEAYEKAKGNKSKLTYMDYPYMVENILEKCLERLKK